MELETLPDGGVVQASDQFVVSRAGAARRVSGSRFTLADGSGNSLLAGDPRLNAGAILRSGTASLIGGDGGANTALYVGTSALNIRNAADSATLLSITNAGVVTAAGSLNVVGSIMQNGQQVYHAGNFNPAAYAPLSGATFTGLVISQTAPGNGYIQLAGNVSNARTGYIEFMRGDGATREAYIGNTLVGGAVEYNSVNGHAFTGNISTTGSISAATNITAGASIVGNAISVASFPVWHAGNFNPAIYAQLSGAIFNGTITVGATNAGGLSYRDRTLPNDASHGWTTYSEGDVFVFYQNTNNAGRVTIDANGNLNAVGSVAAGTGMTIGGFPVFHQGNFDPATKANVAGQAFSGAIRAPSVSVDANLSMSIAGGQSSMTFDAGDAINYDRANNKFLFIIGGTVVASIDSSGNVRARGDFIGNVAP